MSKSLCRKISMINYEYFLYNGSIKSQVEAYKWLHSFEEDAFMETSDIEENAVKLGSRRAGSVVTLKEGEPAVLIRPEGCGEFDILSTEDFDENYKIIRS